MNQTMVVINQLKVGKRKRNKRNGRGGKKGTYSGQGMKGQKSRAGARIKDQERERILKMPKLRGYKFKPLKEKPEVVKLEKLEKAFKENEIVSLESLKARKLISKTAKEAKILSGGQPTKRLTIKGLKISKKAKEEVEKKGGRVLPND